MESPQLGPAPRGRKEGQKGSPEGIRRPEPRRQSKRKKARASSKQKIPLEAYTPSHSRERKPPLKISGEESPKKGGG